MQDRDDQAGVVPLVPVPFDRDQLGQAVHLHGAVTGERDDRPLRMSNLAPMAYGTPGPIVARLPDSEPRMSPRNCRFRAYQLADEPESAVTIASSGSWGRARRTAATG